MLRAGRKGTGVLCVLLLFGLGVGALGGCGSDGGQRLVIDGDKSFGGMPNPGTLKEAIKQFGYPDELVSPYPDSSYMCVARWKAQGIDAQFIAWGAVGATGGPPCGLRSQLTLTGVALLGDWETDKGLKVGDGVDKLNDLYDPGQVGTCAAGLARRRSKAQMLLRVSDPLGGPGSFICTLGVVVKGGTVTGFVMSSRAASE